MPFFFFFLNFSILPPNKNGPRRATSHRGSLDGALLLGATAVSCLGGRGGAAPRCDPHPTPRTSGHPGGARGAPGAPAPQRERSRWGGGRGVAACGRPSPMPKERDVFRPRDTRNPGTGSGLGGPRTPHGSKPGPPNPAASVAASRESPGTLVRQ